VCEEQDAGNKENNGDPNQFLHRGPLVIPDKQQIDL
jgi:hypothetical protein